MTRRGFSLLEIIVTIAVIALVLGIVTPRLDVKPLGMRIRDTTNKINSAFFVAASMAQSTGNVVTLRFVVSEKGGEIELKRSQAKPLRATAPTEWPEEENEFAVAPPSIFDEMDHYRLDERFALDEERMSQMAHEADVAYTFYANGEAAGPDMAFLIDGVPFTLSIDRLTGRPTIVEEDD